MQINFQSFEHGLRFEAYALTKLLNKDKSAVTIGDLRVEISDYLERVKRYAFVFPRFEVETTKRWLLSRKSFVF